MDHATTETENDSTTNSPKKIRKGRKGGKKKKKAATFNQKEDKNKVPDENMTMSKSRQFAKMNEMRQNRVIPLSK